MKFIKNKKNKWWSLLSVGAIAFISTPIVVTSCKRNDDFESKEVMGSKQINQEEWDHFLNNKAIDLILNSIYDDEKEKESFIKSQQSIDTSKYLKEIAARRFYYSNSIPNSNGYSFLNNFPKPYNESRLYQDEMLSKNWLWFLFNIKKFTFIIKPDINLFTETSEEATESLKRNSNQTGSFYKASSNEFNQVVKVEVSDNLNKSIEDLDGDDFLQEYKFVLLNNDGFIFFIDLNKTYNENKVLNKTKISILSWVETLPKLPSFKNNLENEFSLLTFAKFSERLRNNEVVSPIATDIFNEYYGGIPIKYTIADNEQD